MKHNKSEHWTNNCICRVTFEAENWYAVLLKAYEDVSSLAIFYQNKQSERPKRTKFYPSLIVKFYVFAV